MEKVCGTIQRHSCSTAFGGGWNFHGHLDCGAGLCPSLRGDRNLCCRAAKRNYGLRAGITSGISSRGIKKNAAGPAKVVRGGQQQTVPAAQIVPGDIIIIEEGDTIPADARLIQSSALQTAEAALTGESMPVAKDIAPIRQKLHWATAVTCSLVEPRQFTGEEKL